MGEVVITGFMADQIEYYRDQLEPLIEKPLKKTGADKYYTVNDVLDKCSKYEWQCWVAYSEGEKIDCVFVTLIKTHPTGYKVFMIYLVGGSKIEQWLVQAWSLFRQYARAHNCRSIGGGGREGWIRLLQKLEKNEFEKKLSFEVEI